MEADAEENNPAGYNEGSNDDEHDLRTYFLRLTAGTVTHMLTAVVNPM